MEAKLSPDKVGSQRPTQIGPHTFYNPHMPHIYIPITERLVPKTSLQYLFRMTVQYLSEE